MVIPKLIQLERYPLTLIRSKTFVIPMSTRPSREPPVSIHLFAVSASSFSNAAASQRSSSFYRSNRSVKSKAAAHFRYFIVFTGHPLLTVQSVSICKNRAGSRK